MSERTLKADFENRAPSEHPSRWNDLWVEGFTPWDRGLPSPALLELLTERPELLPVSGSTNTGKKLKALVPGCGKGYEVLLLSAFGYDAYGLDVSEKALEFAREHEKEMGSQEVYKTREGVERGKVAWLCGDFFTSDVFKDVQDFETGFDFIYDYTFLCALPLSLRSKWSQRQNELLAPGGRLMCLEFPTNKPTNSGGPPWPLPPKIYQALLPRPGVELKYDDQGVLVESELGPPSPKGLMALAHYQPKKTHKAGYDAEGKLMDFVSIWGHNDSA
ncbi:hypothetical protein BP6252_12294 [Coleophoma cylindrospora]|uniref:Thiol methyltransferase n=1 Tax=Coleophoma cylindrospora TaxID=1849047 RepID=A0A3D8QGR7_9HELO|nr:hypothetical protein BP6252_12294 [Coleophoma cylindrospora]